VVTEIGEHAVTHVFGDKAAVAFDELGSPPVVRTEDRPQVLGIELVESVVEPTR
jgi:hypothetical protein